MAVLDPKTAGHTIKVEIELDLRRSGRPDFIVPLQAERRYGGYRATSHKIVRRTVRITLHSDHPFRSIPISRFGGFRSPLR